MFRILRSKDETGEGLEGAEEGEKAPEYADLNEGLEPVPLRGRPAAEELPPDLVLRYVVPADGPPVWLVDVEEDPALPTRRLWSLLTEDFTGGLYSIVTWKAPAKEEVEAAEDSRAATNAMATLLGRQCRLDSLFMFMVVISMEVLSRCFLFGICGIRILCVGLMFGLMATSFCLEILLFDEEEASNGLYLHD